MDPSVRVRPVTPADAQTYFALRLSGLEESPTAFGRGAEEYRHEPLEDVAAGLEELPGERVTLGAWRGAELLGMITLVRQPADRPRLRHKGNVYGVYVSPGARGLGVGSGLMLALIAWARGCPGLLQLHLGVSVTQDGARRLYTRHGFRVWGLEPRALRIDGQDIDEEHLCLTLDADPA